MSDATQQPSYGSYLQLDQLLACQSPREEGLLHHDEMLFIVVHQTFELWFRQILHELGRARDILGQPERDESERDVDPAMIPLVTELLHRTNEILRVCHEQFTVLETMPTVNFLAFRDALLPASGFQSRQFREFEILMGLEDSDRMPDFGFDYDRMLSEAERSALQARRAEMSVKEAVFNWLSRTPVEAFFPGFSEVFLEAYAKYAESQFALQDANVLLAPEVKRAARERGEAQREALRSWLVHRDEATRRVHEAFVFIASYREAPLLRWPYTLLESLLEFEERVRLFRFRHARMVERIIGFRIGTGGSSGVEYLDATAHRYRIFGELLEGRSFLVARSALPELPNPRGLGFRGDGPDADEKE